MKNPLFIVIAVVLTLIASACSTPTPIATEVQLPLLPTPDVPSIEEVDAAIETWQNSGTTDYYYEIEEETQTGPLSIRLLVEDSEIRVAQGVDYQADGSLGEPYSISLDQAQEYTVDALLSRIRTDVLGEGDSLFNMVTAFSDTLGYPLLVHAEALPTYSEGGTLELNRQHSYDLITNLKPPLEDSYAADTSPIFTLKRSNGPEAWCDTLNILPDGSSLYVDDCRNIFWQLPTPESRLLLLNELRAKFNSLEDIQGDNGQITQLSISGTGRGTPDAATLEEAWQLSAELHDLLSSPTGLGLVMSYVYDGSYIGFDVFNKITMPAQMLQSGDLRGAILTPDGEILAYSDDDGVTAFTLQSQVAQQLLPTPEDGDYVPRAWSNSNRLIVSNYPTDEQDTIQHGWVSVEENTWHELLTPEGVSGYGCDTGLAWSPTGEQLAITGLGYGEECNRNPGLTIIDFSRNSAEVIVAPQIESLDQGGASITAGAHTPAWSPDGTWIAFGLDQNPDKAANFPTRLYRAHPDGSNLTPLTNNSHGNATHPVWAGNGSLYYGLSAADAELDGLYHYSATNNSHTLLLPGSGIHPLSISPDGEFLLFEQQGGLKIWRIQLGEIVADITGDEDNQPAFSGWIVVEGEQ